MTRSQEWANWNTKAFKPKSDATMYEADPPSVAVLLFTINILNPQNLAQFCRRETSISYLSFFILWPLHDVLSAVDESWFEFALLSGLGTVALPLGLALASTTF